ncbi:uncharacterized protein LOC143376584 [Andrena cerasifolii]|uniref:uncharacterized protein LOC143376584 n=1 Tax=Andrena cerasifolii TaxID=2819439 RepID=UPI004037E279
MFQECSDLQSEDVHRCECGKWYKHSSNLRLHQSIECGRNKKRHLCVQLRLSLSISDKFAGAKLPYGLQSGFKSYPSSIRHQRHQAKAKHHSRNDGNTMNVCFGCGKRYKWRDSLLRHQRVECGNKEKKFSCTLCPKKFYHQYKLNEHYQGRHKLPKPH